MINKNIDKSNLNVIYYDSSIRRRNKLSKNLKDYYNFVFLANDYDDFIRLVKENLGCIDFILIDMDFDLEKKETILNEIKKIDPLSYFIGIHNLIDTNRLQTLIDSNINKIIIKNDIDDIFTIIKNETSKINLISELRKIKFKYKDIVTGLPNSDKLTNDINPNKDSALFIINVDKFRHINETYGYNIGNKVSEELSDRLKSFIPNKFFKLYKLQINEYALLIRNKFILLDYNKIADLIYNLTCEDSYIYDDISIPITISIGIAINNNVNNELLKEANFALENCKKYEKKYHIYSNDIDYNNELYEWTYKIKDAIENDRIILYYQPLINNITKKVVKYEALIRLKDKTGKVYSPFFFLDIAKKIKLYPQLTKIVVSKAIEKFNNMKEKVSINLSASDMTDEKIQNFILEKLNKNEDICKQIVWEVLETEAISNYDEIKLFLDKLKAKGCQIAIDDFGTGYSNYSNVIKLNVDCLKIDGSIVKEILEDRPSQIIIKSIVSFAKDLNLEIISEYVENEAIYLKVKELGIDLSQGYYFSKPLPEENIKNSK